MVYIILKQPILHTMCVCVGVMLPTHEGVSCFFFISFYLSFCLTKKVMLILLYEKEDVFDAFGPHMDGVNWEHNLMIVTMFFDVKSGWR